MPGQSQLPDYKLNYERTIHMKSKNVNKLVTAALIAAMYAALTAAVAPLAYGAIQLRVSEALTVLPLFSSVAIPGLTIGCLLANIIGLSLGQTVVWDILFGTIASLIAAVITYIIGKSKSKKVRYVLGPFPAVIVNAIVVGLEITIFFTDGGASATAFWFNFISVFIGQALVCYIIGIPLIMLLEKNQLYKKLFKN